MIKDKKDVRAYICKFKCIDEGISALGFLSYHTFSKDKIAKEFEGINAFFRQNFKINKRTIKYIDLTFDETDNMWLKIDSLYDIELLDELIAFGIASGALGENLQHRFYQSFLNPYNIQLLNEDPNNLENYGEDEYIRAIKRIVLPTSKLDVSEATLARYRKEKPKRIYSPERQKELLLSWWDKGVDHAENRQIFMELLEQDSYDDLVLLIFSLYSSGRTSANLSELITRQSLSNQLDYTHLLYKSSTEEGKRDIQEGVQEMFDALDNLEPKKKRHL